MRVPFILNFYKILVKVTYIISTILSEEPMRRRFIFTQSSTESSLIPFVL